MNIRFLATLVLAASLPLGTAEPAAAQSSRVPTVTRLVKLFSELEAGLVAQAHSSDAAALEASLDPAFELRAGSMPGTPMPRDEWIRQARAAATRGTRIEQMAVHDFGDLAVVSFREVAADAGRGGNRSARFIVDCWKRSGDNWKLAVRYSSEVAAISSTDTPPKIIDKRY